MIARQAILRAARGAAAPRRALAAAPLAATRSFAAAAQAPSQEAKPSASVYGIDGTYATALFTAASKSSTLDPTARALTTLSALFDRDARLGDVLAAPTLTPADKAIIVEELQKQAGASGAGAKTMENFLKTLAENNRLGLLRAVCDKFAVLMSSARGEVEMVVTSATALDPRTLSRLESAVAKSQYVGPGSKLKVSNKVDPDIIGGLMVEIGDRTIDLSVSARLGKMNKLLTDAL